MPFLPSDEEQDWTDVPDEPRLSFLIPGSFREVPNRRSITLPLDPLFLPPPLLIVC